MALGEEHQTWKLFIFDERIKDFDGIREFFYINFTHNSMLANLEFVTPATQLSSTGDIVHTNVFIDALA